MKDYGFKIDKRRAYADWERMAQNVYLKRVSLSPGLFEFLDKLGAAGIPAGIVSSSPHRWIKLVVERFKLAPRLKAVVSADDVEGPGKPEPAVYLLAAKNLGVEPARCVAVEDSENGVRSAMAAGCIVIAVPCDETRGQDFTGAHQVIGSLTEFDLSLVATE